MKKVFILLILMVFTVALPVLAEEEYNEEYYEENYGVGLDFNSNGFMVGYMLINGDELCKAIVEANYPELNKEILIYGGTSLIGFHNGMRWGGFGYGGETKNVDSFTNAMSKLSIGMGGINLDYGVCLTRKLDVSVGGMFGFGGYVLTLRKKPLEDMQNPNQIYLTNTFFVLGPRATIFYQINDWFAFEGVAGYFYGLGKGKWKDDILIDKVVPPLRINSLFTGISFNLSI